MHAGQCEKIIPLNQRRTARMAEGDEGRDHCADVLLLTISAGNGLVSSDTKDGLDWESSCKAGSVFRQCGAMMCNKKGQPVPKARSAFSQMCSIIRS